MCDVFLVTIGLYERVHLPELCECGVCSRRERSQLPAVAVAWTRRESIADAREREREREGEEKRDATEG